jgi:hypothetical protein
VKKLGTGFGKILYTHIYLLKHQEVFKSIDEEFENGFPNSIFGRESVFKKGTYIVQLLFINRLQ